MAHMMDLFSDQEMATAMAEPSPIPLLTTVCCALVLARARNGVSVNAMIINVVSGNFLIIFVM